MYLSIPVNEGAQAYQSSLEASRCQSWQFIATDAVVPCGMLRLVTIDIRKFVGIAR